MDARAIIPFSVAVFLASATALLAPGALVGQLDPHLGALGMLVVAVLAASMNALASAAGLVLGLALRRALVRRQVSPRSRWIAFAYGVATVAAGFLLARLIRPHGLGGVAAILGAVSLVAGLWHGRVTTSTRD